MKRFLSVFFTVVFAFLQLVRLLTARERGSKATTLIATVVRQARNLSTPKPREYFETLLQEILTFRFES